jgi:hypothetical protein
MADAEDLKSSGAKAPCGFESRPRQPQKSSFDGHLSSHANRAQIDLPACNARCNAYQGIGIDWGGCSGSISAFGHALMAGMVACGWAIIHSGVVDKRTGGEVAVCMIAAFASSSRGPLDTQHALSVEII